MPTPWPPPGWHPHADDEVVGYEGHVGPGGWFSARPVTRGELARRPGCRHRLLALLLLAPVAMCALADDGPRVFGLPPWATPGFLLSLGFNVGVGAALAGLAGLLLRAPRGGCAGVVLLLVAANCAAGVRAGREALSWRLVGAAIAILAVLGVANGVGRVLIRTLRGAPRGAPRGGLQRPPPAARPTDRR